MLNTSIPLSRISDGAAKTFMLHKNLYSLDLFATAQVYATAAMDLMKRERHFLTSIAQIRVMRRLERYVMLL